MLSAFVRKGLVYEDLPYHNAVFVGLDAAGVPRHAHKRSTNSEGKTFRLNVEGSDPAHSFHWVGTSRQLYVFEAPIDLLSYITLHPEGWQRHSYVALCGVSGQALFQAACGILHDGARRASMERAMSALGIRDATERIYQTVLEICQ